MFEFDINKQSIVIDGQRFSKEQILTIRPETMQKNSFRSDVIMFLKEWFSDFPEIQVYTSGSTGQPKSIHVNKTQMMQSAALTCKFLDLRKADKALLCMPIRYIAGKMVVVRALIADLNLTLVSPCGNPLQYTDSVFDFAAMIPLQVFNSLSNHKEKQKLASIKNLIIGGGAIDMNLSKQLKDLPNQVYSTYGMTETLSHIALRKLNGSKTSEFYKPFQSVQVSLDKDNCLTIDAPLISDKIIYTHDIAEINTKGEFRILGRKDNIINSGGIKLQPETIEAAIKSYIIGEFAISSLPDKKFGELPVLVLQEKSKIIKDLNLLDLPKYWLPKVSLLIKNIPLTETGKINRPELKKLILTSQPSTN